MATSAKGLIAALLLLGCDAALSSEGLVVLRFDAGAEGGVVIAAGADTGPAPPDLGIPDAGGGDLGVPPRDALPAPAPDARGAPPPPPPDAATEPPPPPPPPGRSEPEVCAYWAQEHVGVGAEWQPSNPGDACDLGVVSDEGQRNGIRRTNLYRWLAGLEPVSLEPSLLPQQQACAVIQDALGGLNHHPPADSPCYTDLGARGAGSSNLVAGTGLADSVDLYVSDRGVPSLGHRRWVLNPTARVTAFGHKGRFGCMYSFSSEGPVTADFVAWPPPGFVPTAAAHGTAHVSLYRVRPGPEFRVEVAVDDGEYGQVVADRLPGGYGGQIPAYAWDMPRNLWADGTRLRVALRGLNGPDVTWETTFTDCR